jgi:formylglycine-generating enzyme required for sulfatase activity
MRLLSGTILTLGACTSASPGGGDAPVTGTVRLELPPGFVGTLDDRAEPLEPGADHAVLAGEHEVVVRTPCGEHRAEVVVAAGRRVVLEHGDFEGLQLAKLTIAATNLEQKPLLPTVTLGEWAVPGHASTATVVPACKARLNVSVPGLGAFIEDVELSEGDEMRRAVVLAPGSDVVRIQGGTLVFREGRLFPDIRNVVGELEEDPFGEYEHTIATYDIDQREVTTAEFHACHQAGACVSTFDKRMKTPFPLDREAHLCTSDVTRELRPPVPGKEDIAMNCVVRWEAEEYCRWVGKRLPDVEEWEFAGRSRGDDRLWLEDHKRCELGKPVDQCPRKAQKEAAAPCVVESPKTSQGLCDMFGNLAELVVTTPRSQWTAAAGGSYHGNGLPWGHDNISAGAGRVRYGERQDPDLGFRCARTVAGSHANAIGREGTR